MDWHILLPNPDGGQAAEELAGLRAGHDAPDLRRYLDAIFGPWRSSQEPQRNGDFLCPDGRYRIGDITGTVRLQPRSEALIGVVRRQAAAAARREELAPASDACMQELQGLRASSEREREKVAHAEQRARALSELAHMLDEVEQRRAR